METIGEGAYAQVYSSEEGVAIKVIADEDVNSAIREALLINACDNPNVIKMINVKSAKNSTEIRLEQCHADLRKVLDDYSIEASKMLQLARNIISAVAHVHSRGIIHGDIKSSNILVNNGEAILCDFGISVLDTEEYHSGLIQTCTYRAPEINETKRRTKFTPKIDMWSVGCVLYEMAMGSAIVKYNQFISDSSVYAAKIMNINGCADRRERLKVLRDLRFDDVRSIISKKMESHPEYKKLIKSKYIDLISLMLIPDHHVRVSSENALMYINDMLGYRLNSDKPVRLVPDYDNFTVIRGIDHRVIRQSRPEHLMLAESIYRKINKNGDTTVNYKLACIYISTCLYLNEPVRHLISGIRANIKKYVFDVLDMIDWRI
jgi:serine/threonine protein kinase